MRLRTTAAAAFLGAVALVLPTAGASLAGGDDGRILGVLRYRFVNEQGNERAAEIFPVENDTCYRLTHTSEDDPAFEVRNETESLAVLFRDGSCGGEAERVLEPGEWTRNVAVASAFFKPVDDGHHGRYDDFRNDFRDGGRRTRNMQMDRTQEPQPQAEHHHEEASDPFGFVFKGVG